MLGTLAGTGGGGMAWGLGVLWRVLILPSFADDSLLCTGRGLGGIVIVYPVRCDSCGMFESGRTDKPCGWRQRSCVCPVVARGRACS